MVDHITRTSFTRFYHLYIIGKIGIYLTKECKETPKHAVISGRLEYNLFLGTLK